ncbi:hypothetical protein [Halotia branconii]|uniref:DUF7847 domain-containing protein n=1 Tax=Halotia branconii CENA392 TaxID=1539056 RepID=A0AAJ6PAR2_9CYAN|nr:hypothetical protein [Halotia branconii]WGV27149.1 hypothetical protein QI031_06555 [Halotia branconii CENA392]
MHELNIVFYKSFLAIQKYWFSLLTITFITEGIVLLTQEFVKNQTLDFLGFLSSPGRVFLGFFVISLLTPLGKAAVACLISQGQAQPSSGLVAYLEVIKVLPLVLTVGILWYIGTIIGLGLLLIPGICFFFYSQFVAQALVVEKLSIVAAFQRSWDLVKQKFWTLVVLFFALEIGQGVVSEIFSAVIFAIIPSAKPYIVEWFVATVVAISVYVPLAVMYLERSKKG